VTPYVKCRKASKPLSLADLTLTTRKIARVYLAISARRCQRFRLMGTGLSSTVLSSTVLSSTLNPMKSHQITSITAFSIPIWYGISKFSILCQYIIYLESTLKFYTMLFEHLIRSGISPTRVRDSALFYDLIGDDSVKKAFGHRNCGCNKRGLCKEFIEQVEGPTLWFRGNNKVEEAKKPLLRADNLVSSFPNDHRKNNFQHDIAFLQCDPVTKEWGLRNPAETSSKVFVVCSPWQFLHGRNFLSQIQNGLADRGLTDGCMAARGHRVPCTRRDSTTSTQNIS
jgi:hypothetical protein